MLSPAEARKLLESIDTGALAGLRDRALLSVMFYSFARVSAVLHRDLSADVSCEGPGADSFSPQKAAALFRTFAARGTAQVPTLVALRSVWDAQADWMTEQDRRAADRGWDRSQEMVRLMRDIIYMRVVRDRLIVG